MSLGTATCGCTGVSLVIWRQTHLTCLTCSASNPYRHILTTGVTWWWQQQQHTHNMIQHDSSRAVQGALLRRTSGQMMRQATHQLQIMKLMMVGKCLGRVHTWPGMYHRHCNDADYAAERPCCCLTYPRCRSLHRHMYADTHASRHARDIKRS